MKKTIQKVGVTIIGLLLLVACSTPDQKMQKYLTGNWEMIYVKLEYKTFQNKDTAKVIDVDFTNPADIAAELKTYYKHKSNGVFESWRVRNNISVGEKTIGTWRASVDSLYYTFGRVKQDSVTVAFGVKKIEDGFSLTAIQDRDRDGKKDDIFYVETVRLPDNSFK